MAEERERKRGGEGKKRERERDRCNELEKLGEERKFGLSGWVQFQYNAPAFLNAPSTANFLSSEGRGNGNAEITAGIFFRSKIRERKRLYGNPCPRSALSVR